jgi:hypothetical protein
MKQYSKYDQIIQAIAKDVPLDCMICLMLGQIVAVMVSNQANFGYIAWDIGHIAKDYNSYMNKLFIL